MDQNNKQRGNIFSANDTLDINELAALNDDISPEFIEQLQNQVAQNASEFIGKPFPAENKVVEIEKEDSELFEEVPPVEPSTDALNNNAQKPSGEIKLDENLDDNFIKKYKAKLEKQENTEKNVVENAQVEDVTQNTQTIENSSPQDTNKIEELTSGNIVEKPISQTQIDYNNSLDLIDDNTRYAKYVIYVDPENTEFIESLTVKERKNLINRILREQDDIALTRKRFRLIQTVLKHIVIAVITFAITIPVVYWTINASLEASINNYKRSKTIFKTLYREKGKIKKQNQY